MDSYVAATCNVWVIVEFPCADFGVFHLERIIHLLFYSKIRNLPFGIQPCISLQHILFHFASSLPGVNFASMICPRSAT